MTQTRKRNASLAAICGLIPALLLTACNSDNGGGSTTPVAPPHATTGSTASGAAGTKAPAGTGNGAKLAAAIALSPAEWGKDFVKDDPYEDASLDYSQLDASCKWHTGQAPASLSGVMYRYVRVPMAGQTDDSSNQGFTNAYVYGTVADALKDIVATKSGLRRCQSYSSDDGKVNYKNIHEVTAPTIPLADEVFAEEGLEEYPQEQGTPTTPYVTLFARKGTVTLVATLDGAPGSSPVQLRVQTQGAITAMLLKLKAQGQ